MGVKQSVTLMEEHKQHKEELCDLYSSPSLIRIIRSRRMMWTGHLARMGGEMDGM
jgi:hypothetical protein